MGIVKKGWSLKDIYKQAPIAKSLQVRKEGRFIRLYDEYCDPSLGITVRKVAFEYEVKSNWSVGVGIDSGGNTLKKVTEELGFGVEMGCL